jgi:hypothetical protein
MLALSDPSSLQSKLDLNGKEENTVDTKKKSACLPQTETFEAEGIKTSLHGYAYQLKLLMLFACNSYQLGNIFRLTTEMRPAGKFDVVVILYVKAGSDVQHWRFLQAKQFQKESESKKITATDLRMWKKGKFNLRT